MSRNIIYLCLIVVVAFAACEKVIPFNPQYGKSRLVLNSVLSKDSTVKVGLTKSSVIVDPNEISIVNNAEVKLYENNQFVGNLELNNNYYTLNHVIAEGKNYSITAVSDGFDMIKSDELVPEKRAITKIDTARYTDQDGNVNFWFNMSFDNNKTKNEYLMVRCLLTSTYTVENENGDPQEQTTSYYIAIEDESALTTELDDGSILFADELINEDDYEIRGSVYLDVTSKNEYRFELHSISKGYYDYLITRDQHLNAQGNPLMEPVIIYSNISSGMGILGCSTIDTVLVNFNPQQL